MKNLTAILILLFASCQAQDIEPEPVQEFEPHATYWDVLNQSESGHVQLNLIGSHDAGSYEAGETIKVESEHYEFIAKVISYEVDIAGGGMVLSVMVLDFEYQGQDDYGIDSYKRFR
jgi:hypothetical protein